MKLISRIRKHSQLHEPRATWSAHWLPAGSRAIYPLCPGGDLHPQCLLSMRSQLLREGPEVPGNEKSLPFLCPHGFCPVSLSCLMSTSRQLVSQAPLTQVLAYPTYTPLWSPVHPPLSDLICTFCLFPSRCFNYEVGAPQLRKLQLPTLCRGRERQHRRPACHSLRHLVASTCLHTGTAGCSASP